MLKIRLMRMGRKKKPFYRIVVMRARTKRNGPCIDRLGFYNPTLPSEHLDRLSLNTDRVVYWLSKGAQPTERVAIFLAQKGLRPTKQKLNPLKGKPKARAQKRLEEEAALQAQVRNAAGEGMTDLKEA